jgi:ankyrin repeat protein
MFPNPQDALPLPPRPNLEQYRKLAKDLTRACRSGKPDQIGEWAEKWIETLARLLQGRITAKLQPQIDRWIGLVQEFAERTLSRRDKARSCSLADAQFVIARSHGFQSWPRFSSHIESLVRASSPISQFELAADAIVGGDVITLKRLLDKNPKLIRARSTREHRATLLHYVSANGVESYRQKTPERIVKVAELLLDAGADVDAEADVYGGGCTTLRLTATSYHPRRAGVQNALIRLLLDRGASMEVNRKGQSLVMDSLANGCPGAAEFLARNGASLDLETAAALGRFDDVKSFFNEDGSLKDQATMRQMESGFIWACGNGHNSVIEFLIDRGVDLGTQRPGDRQTGLHWAAVGGNLETVKLLLNHSAPLEKLNAYGGTVLGQTLWSAAHGGDPDVYVAIIEALLAAGARLGVRHPPINRRVDELLQRFGSQSDKSLWWYGEEPREKKKEEGLTKKIRRGSVDTDVRRSIK